MKDQIRHTWPHSGSTFSSKNMPIQCTSKETLKWEMQSLLQLGYDESLQICGLLMLMAIDGLFA